MRKTPLYSGIFYLLLGLLFVFLAVLNVNEGGWGFFTYLLIIFATFDIGAGIRIIWYHMQLKNEGTKK